MNGFNVGAAVAAVLAGHLLVDRHGRHPALLMGSLLFALGGGVQGSAQNRAMLIVGRVVAGIGVGITSSAGPAFISEVAPEKIRGMLVGIYQNNVCLAIVAAAVLNYAVHDTVLGWRLSLGLQVATGPYLGVHKLTEVLEKGSWKARIVTLDHTPSGTLIVTLHPRPLNP